MATLIGVYNYTYGGGDQVNRQLQFSRTGNDPSTIQARVFALNPDGSVRCQTSTVPGNRIEVEMENGIQRVHTVVLGGARNENRCLTGLLLVQQNLVVQQASSGNRRISLQNSPVPGGNERVTQLVISALL